MSKSSRPSAPMPKRPPRIAIALVSVCALAYEILLMRLFSIIQWHHFAYMIISIALLGYGASGTVITIAGERLLLRFRRNFIAFTLLFSLTTFSCFLIAQNIEFNAQEALWDTTQLGKLFVIYLLLALPFFFAASAIALTLLKFNDKCGSIYAADLLGASCGSLLVIALLYRFVPSDTLLIITALSAAASAAAMLELGYRSLLMRVAIAFIFLVLIGLPDKWLKPVISPYKSMSQALRIKGTRIIAQHSSPLGLISVVESKAVPWRHAPGLSLNATMEPPEQLAIFSDADNMSAITRFNGDYQSVAYLDQQTSALAYHLTPINKAVILGAGGGAGILQAGFHQVEKIHGVEINPQIIAIVRADNNFSGSIFDSPTTKMHIAEARGFMSQTTEHFDMIQVEMLDSFTASAAGLYALHESYLYTVEALQQYIRRLNANGYLSISRWIRVPPRDALKLFATGLAALENNGVEKPERQLILIRGWQTSTLVIKNGNISMEEIRALKKFCKERSFDLAYYPGIRRQEANKYNLLREPFFHDGVQALLSRKAAFIQNYKFNIAPATDDTPYFNHFLKASTIPEFFKLRNRGGFPLIEWGYIILLATLVQAMIASSVLIVLPLKFRKTAGPKTHEFPFHVFLYFSAIGLGFIFLEIAFIQRFLLFLHHPLFATALVVTAFLAFAGMGSSLTNRLLRKHAPETILSSVLCLIMLLGIIYIPLLDMVMDVFLGHHLAIKTLASILLIGPLAIGMGLPFPLALNRLSSYAPPLIPWAWGVNGCASVISAVLAMLLAIHGGFSVVIGTALLCYGTAFLAFLNWPSSRMRPSKA